jgi:DNA ligase D-like protein (predicted 3'-phosphoesterase)
MPAAKKLLAEYSRKRDFKKTSEPSGARRPKKPKGKFPSFVIQKHDATRLHYDFRLEVGGVLKSWAVPKGPSLDPSQRRLAMQTEDHPLDYASFEGVIPEGEYGGGPVIVWDRGYYLNITLKGGRVVPMEKALAQGHVKIWLEGEKIRGGYALARIERADDPKSRRAWLLIKHKDDGADVRRDPVRDEPRSVKTRRTVEEVGAIKKF